MIQRNQTKRRLKSLPIMPVKKDIKKPFFAHVQELRARVLICLIVLGINSAIGYFFHQQIIQFLLVPIKQQLIYTSPAGGFTFIFHISFLFGIFFSLPFFIYHVFGFIGPALSRHDKKGMILFTLFSFLLSVSGVIFSYKFSLPLTLKFLSHFNSQEITSLLTAHEYLSFVTTYLLGCALLFQMPLVFFFINTIKQFEVKTLMSLQRYIIVGSFIAGFILAPDPLNQLVLALPLMLLYQCTVVLLWIVNRKSIFSKMGYLH